MSRWALVDNNEVVTTVEQDDQPTVVLPFWPNGVWIGCPDSVSGGFTYENGVFKSPPANTPPQTIENTNIKSQ